MHLRCNLNATKISFRCNLDQKQIDKAKVRSTAQNLDQQIKSWINRSTNQKLDQQIKS